MPEPFAWGRRQPINVLLQLAGEPLVHMDRCYMELREEVFDAANRANARACRSMLVFDTYATALMGGDPYSNWS